MTHNEPRWKSSIGYYFSPFFLSLLRFLSTRLDSGIREMLLVKREYMLNLFYLKGGKRGRSGVVCLAFTTETSRLMRVAFSSDKRGHRGEKLGGALPFKSRWIFAWQTATLPAARREIEACFLIRTINSWQGSASLGRCQYEIRTRRRRGQTPTKHTQRKASI